MFNANSVYYLKSHIKHLISNIFGLPADCPDLGCSDLAGELFQKFINYMLRAAIVLPDPGAYGERFSELAYEHASHSMVRFFSSKDEAKGWLSQVDD